MLTVEERIDLKLLSVQGHSIRAIAEMTGLSRNTVRRALRQKTPQAFTPPKSESKLEEFKGYIEKRYNECALSTLRLLGEIQGMRYEDGVDTMRRHERTSRGPGRSLEKLTVRCLIMPAAEARTGSLQERLSSFGFGILLEDTLIRSMGFTASYR